MTSTESSMTPDRPERPVPVTIIVNNKPVKLRESRTSGLVIKKAAIAQGVAIELDFQLAMILDDGRHQIIGDDETIRVSRGTKFVATAHDDNSADGHRA